MEKSVLIIDKDKTIVNLIKTMLEFHDFKVFYSNDKKDLKDILGNEMINIVIGDIMVPGLDMIKMAKVISQDKSIPMIMTGIKQLDSNERKVLFCYHIPFMQKPISTNLLFEKVRDLVK